MSKMKDLKYAPYIIFAIIVIAFFVGGWDKICAASVGEKLISVGFLGAAAFVMYKATKVVGNAMLGIWLIIGSLVCLGFSIAFALNYF